MNKKSQLKIQEMSFMLMAVVLFFIIALLFIFVIKYREMYQVATQLGQEKALSTVANIANTAEFTCSGQSSLCIDADKLIVLQNREEYNGFWWPITSLSVVKIFPSANKTLIKCTQDNYPNCNLFEIYKEAESLEIIEDQKTENSGAVSSTSLSTVSTFVSLCRKDVKNDYKYEKCEIAKILAGYKIKQPE